MYTSRCLSKIDTLLSELLNQFEGKRAASTFIPEEDNLISLVDRLTQDNHIPSFHWSTGSPRITTSPHFIGRQAHPGQPHPLISLVDRLTQDNHIPTFHWSTGSPRTTTSPHFIGRQAHPGQPHPPISLVDRLTQDNHIPSFHWSTGSPINGRGHENEIRSQ